MAPGAGREGPGTSILLGATVRWLPHPFLLLRSGLCGRILGSNANTSSRYENAGLKGVEL